MERSIFALELCLRLTQGSPLRQRLFDLVSSHPKESTYDQKWRLYSALTRELAANLSLAERGCWDFFDDDARATKDFKMWCDGMITEEGARKEPSGAPDPYRGEPRFMTFTMAFLLIHGTPSERAIASLCDIPEARLWHRSTFGTLLRGLRALSFPSVIADVVYLIPGREDYGLTMGDLAESKFDYLRPVVG